MTEAPSQFTARVLKEARSLLEAQPEGFRHADLAAVLGAEFAAGGAGYERLRWALKRLRETGVLASGGRGVFQAGAYVGDGYVLGASLGVAESVERFMAENGGMGSVKELARALGLDGGQVSTLFRVLAAGRYVQLPKLQTERRWWALPKAELLRTPLPGWRLDQDTSLSIYYGGARHWRGGDWSKVDQRRREIGQGVRRARLHADLCTDELLTGAVGAEFLRCLEAGPSWVAGARGYVRYGEWWRKRAEDIGQDDAALFAWGDFEDGQRQGEPCSGDNLDAQFWRVLGATLSVDAADLSRGAF